MKSICVKHSKQTKPTPHAHICMYVCAHAHTHTQRAKYKGRAYAALNKQPQNQATENKPLPSNK